MWPLAAALFLTYATTLGIFPGFMAEDVQVGGVTWRTGCMGGWLGEQAACGHYVLAHGADSNVTGHQHMADSLERVEIT